MVWVIIGVLFAVVAAPTVLLLRRRQKPLVSIVLLRRSTARLSEADVRSAARRIIGPEVQVIAGPSPDPGVCDAFVVMLGEMPGFFIINAARTYVDDVQEQAMRFENPEARQAFAGHVAWVAVDLVGKPPKRKWRRQVEQMQGRLAAELLDDECLMLYAPALERFAIPAPDVVQRLRGEDPLSIFSDDSVNTPIINVENNDRRVEKAIQEAQRNWPTFIEVWNRAGAQSHAMVKGRFPTCEGNEYMWIEVSELTAADVAGQLANEPAHVPDLRKGSHVRIAHSEVVDWLCLDGEEPYGGYVERVLRGG